MMEISNKIIQGLWVNGNLKRLQQLCIQSFIENGHEFHLYTYEKEINAPPKTVLKQACEIFPENHIFLDERGSLTAFADLFRYELLYQKGGWWVDMDIVCLKPFDFASQYVFSSTYDEHNQPIVNISTIKTPIHSNFMDYCRSQAQRYLKSNKSIIKWAQLGRDIPISYMKKNKSYNQFIQESNIFCPIPYYFFQILFTDISIDFTEKVYGVHFANEMLRLRSIDTNKSFSSNSFFERIYRKYFNNESFNI